MLRSVPAGSRKFRIAAGDGHSPRGVDKRSRKTHTDTKPRKKRPENESTPQKTLLPPELLGDAPLRLVIVGHNPSEQAWIKGHYYANPNNWMWRILAEVGFAPPSLIRNGANDDFKMPGAMGIGFVDVGSGVPGTDSSQFTSQYFKEWRQPFYKRLIDHTARAGSPPRVIAFSGKRQFLELFEKKHRPKTISVGRQTILPPDWPIFKVNSTNNGASMQPEVWVMTSTSGAAALTREERYGPWKDLASYVLSMT